MGGRNLFWGAEKTEWRGHCGLGYRSLAEPGGVKGCEHKLKSIETVALWVLEGGPVQKGKPMAEVIP